MDLHVYLHKEDDEILHLLKQVLKKESQLMATMQDLRDAVQRNSDIDDSVVTLLNGIVQQLKDAQASNDPAALQAVIDSLDADTKKMADAVSANTPAA